MIKTIKEKYQFHAQKEHIKTNLENRFVQFAVLGITTIEKDHCTAQFVQKVTFVILMTQEKDQFHAQREPGKPNLENHSVWVAVLDIIAVGRGHCTAQFVQKVTGVLTQEKDQFHAQKEHIKINLEDGIVRDVVLDIIAIGKDHCTAELVQKVTFVILMTEEKHQFHA